MIQIINGNRLTRQVFFQELVHYLDSHEEVTLREIKRIFSHYQHIDRAIEEYIKAGYIVREKKRYTHALYMFNGEEELHLDQEVFVHDESTVYHELKERHFETSLSNQTNDIILKETTNIFRDQLTFSNYFYKMRQKLPLTTDQKKLAALLGDVHPEYALKYLTTFLAKFLKKSEVIQKRHDIFVEALLLLGYIRKNEAGKYELQMEVNREVLVFSAKETLF